LQVGKAENIDCIGGKRITRLILP